MEDFSKEMQMVLYTSDEGDVTVDAYVKDETIWLTQKAMAELFGIDKSGISRHLKSIFESGELTEEVVVEKNTTTTQHGAIAGKTQTTESKYYNLDAIISVGYRVNSKQATSFRIWATQVLKDTFAKALSSMMTGLSKDNPYLEQITSESCWKEFVLSEPANAGYGNRLLIYLQNVA